MIPYPFFAETYPYSGFLMLVQAERFVDWLSYVGWF